MCIHRIKVCYSVYLQCVYVKCSSRQLLAPVYINTNIVRMKQDTFITQRPSSSFTNHNPSPSLQIYGGKDKIHKHLLQMMIAVLFWGSMVSLPRQPVWFSQKLTFISASIQTWFPLFSFHSAQRHSLTTGAPNCYNIINMELTCNFETRNCTCKYIFLWLS